MDGVVEVTCCPCAVSGIGANALVTENKVIPDNSLVVGSLGQIVRQVSGEEAKSNTEMAIHYQDNWKKYSKSVF